MHITITMLVRCAICAAWAASFAGIWLLPVRVLIVITEGAGTASMLAATRSAGAENAVLYRTVAKAVNAVIRNSRD